MQDYRQQSTKYTHHSTIVHTYSYHTAIVQVFKLNITCFVREEKTVEEKNPFQHIDRRQPFCLIVRMTAVQNRLNQCVDVIRIIL